jgi:ComF family protein
MELCDSECPSRLLFRKIRDCILWNRFRVGTEARSNLVNTMRLVDGRLLKQLLGCALDVLLPPRCTRCGAEGVQSHGLLCGGCFQGISLISAPLCSRCGVPFAAAALGPVCPACQTTPPRYEQARAALRYDDGARQLILPLKHADRVDLAAGLVPFMVCAGRDVIEAADVIVPVPLHRARLRRRKYNQAGLLARGVARHARRPAVLDALLRTRGTMPLGGKTAAERAAELAGAFMVRPSRVRALAGRRVLLVDDVMTSGATANACAEALLMAGAYAVNVLTAARVPDPRLA